MDTDWLDEQMEDILSGTFTDLVDDFEEWQLRQDEDDEDDVWTLEDLSYEWTGTTDSY